MNSFSITLNYVQVLFVVALRRYNIKYPFQSHHLQQHHHHHHNHRSNRRDAALQVRDRSKRRVRLFTSSIRMIIIN